MTREPIRSHTDETDKSTNMTQLADHLKEPFVDLLLSVADDKFILGHRAADWTGLAPILEEDIAFSAISQEEIAHAAALYELIAPMLDQTADAVAFGREPNQYRCAALVSLEDSFDWAKAIVRHFFCDHWDQLRFQALSQSSYQPLAALAKRIAAEETTHVDHADVWVLRLGQGEAKERMQRALDELAPWTGGLAEPTQGLDALIDAALYPHGHEEMYERWKTQVQGVIDEAGLQLTLSAPPADALGGRQGRHREEFAALLDEMCEVYRTEPEAAW